MDVGISKTFARKEVSCKNSDSRKYVYNLELLKVYCMLADRVPSIELDYLS